MSVAHPIEHKHTHNKELQARIQSLKYEINTQLMYPLHSHLYAPMILTVCDTRPDEPFSTTSLLKRILWYSITNIKCAWFADWTLCWCMCWCHWRNVLILTYLVILNCSWWWRFYQFIVGLFRDIWLTRSSAAWLHTNWFRISILYCIGVALCLVM